MFNKNKIISAVNDHINNKYITYREALINLYLNKNIKYINYNITTAEYFIDSDPGMGNGIPIDAAYGNSITDIDINIPTDELDLGVHWAFVRFKDSEEKWSAPRGSPFSSW